jgi:aspartyl-tRNA(Asn)/glutamyl-tRNA(Gln) amidotransferase subunit A
MTISNKEIIKLGALEIAQKLHDGELTSRVVVDAFLGQIEAVEDKINAFVVTTSEQARLVADHIDLAVSKFGAKRAKLTPDNIANWKAVKVLGEKCLLAVDANDELHPLAGVPIAVKDVVVTKGIQSTSGSKILEGWIPPYDATLNLKLRHAGLPILGKTNMDEFAMGSSTEHSAYGDTHNPWDLDRIPGGSGGGSAAAVAAFEAPLAIGTDTGGSIRQPAAVTGTVGAKPTYGAISRYGLIALASSLDQAGPVARNVDDAAVLQDLLQGHDPHDSTSIPEDLPSNYEAALKGRKDGLKGIKVGLVKELMGDGFAPLVEQRFEEAVKVLEELGAEVVEVSCPHFEYALGAYYLIMPAEASSNLAKFDGMRYGNRENAANVTEMMSKTRGKLLGDEVKRRIILGTYALSSGHYSEYYGLAQKIRTLILQDFDNAFKQADVLVSPTAPTVAFKLGEKLNDPMAMYLNDIATIPSNLAGTPGISIPSGIAEEGLPAGIQILAPQKGDALLYQVSAALEGKIGTLDIPDVS